jgi:hypothetical protein
MQSATFSSSVSGLASVVLVGGSGDKGGTGDAAPGACGVCAAATPAPMAKPNASARLGPAPKSTTFNRM